ncbi:MAG: DUF4242 domain-containing protein, partial [Chloroflexota bacterium]
MALFLLEYPAAAGDREEVRPLFDRVADAVQTAGGEFIEAQVPTGLDRAYIVVEHPEEAGLRAALEQGGATPGGVAQVRLVGASLDDVKAARNAADADYLVEWDFPAGLAMDTYLERKKAKSPLYAQVPEVRFLRTYVCEDMTKCLCFYQAQDEAAVRRAREVVSTPITRLSPLAGGGAGGAGAPA